MRKSTMFACVTLATVAAWPGAARAWWVRPAFWGPRVVVAPPPVVVAPPPVAYLAPPPRRPLVWVRPHFNRFGAWILGH